MTERVPWFETVESLEKLRDEARASIADDRPIDVDAAELVVLCNRLIDLVSPEFSFKSLIVEDDGTLKVEGLAPHWLSRAIAAEIFASVENAGGPNYAEDTMALDYTMGLPQSGWDGDCGRVAVAYVRPGGKTPHELRVEADERAKALEYRLSGIS